MTFLKTAGGAAGSTFASLASQIAAGLAPVVRPETYGALADGTTNDDIAIRAAVDAVAAAGGGIVQFTPGKTYGWASSAVITAKNKVTLSGYGATIKHLPGLVLQSGADVGTFGNWQKCDDLKILGLRIDLNNLERFGGFQIGGCARPLVQSTYAYDSNLNASWATYDHYSFVFNKLDDGTLCSDVRMFDIQADDVELVEADNCNGFTLSRFVSRRAAGTTGVGWFSVHSNEVLTNYDISHGLIIDPRKRGMNVTHETSGPDNNTLKRCRLADLRILKLTETGGTSALLTIGNAGGAASSGNVYEDFTMENIELYVDPGVTDLVRPVFSINPTSGHDFKRAKLKNINIFGDSGASEWSVDLRQLTDADVDGLTVRGAQLGLLLISPKDSHFRNVTAEGSLAAVQVTTSRGGNQGRLGTYGSSSTPYSVIAGAHATDAWTGVEGTVGTVASTAALTLHPSSDIFTVTGTANITSIVATGQVGREVTLTFSGTAAATGLTAGSNLKIPANFVYTPNDTYKLFCDGVNWYSVTPGVVNP